MRIDSGRSPSLEVPALPPKRAELVRQILAGGLLPIQEAFIGSMEGRHYARIWSI